jgi:hypothetical protein
LREYGLAEEEGNLIRNYNALRKVAGLGQPFEVEPPKAKSGRRAS